jgi:hypothetical protein
MGFQVVGYDETGEPVYQEVRGSVMGSVMGYFPNVEGEEYEGVDGFGVVGARRRRRHPIAHPRAIIPPPKPQWRGGDLAHGVEQPDEGMLPMPLTGAGGTNTFTATVGNITFQGQMQKPYRAERMIFIVTRIGASAANLRVQGQIFVGTDLQQGELGLIDFESLGAPTAFGTRLTLTPASPGVFLRLQGQLVGGALAGTDQILVNTYFLGRVIH